MTPAPQLRAFERTYRDEGPFVAAVLGRLAVPTEAVHDAVQDVFVAAYRRWPDYDESRPVRPWLTAFAHRVAFRYRRSQARRDRKRAALRHVHPTRQRSDAERATARAFLERFLDELDEGHRRVFVLTELEGRTAPEVAEAVGISAEAVYGRVRSVRKRLHRAVMNDARRPGARAASLVPPWSLLVPKLGVSSFAAGLGLTGGGLKAFAITVGIGTVALGSAAAVSPTPESAPVLGAAIPSLEPAEESSPLSPRSPAAAADGHEVSPSPLDAPVPSRPRAPTQPSAGIDTMPKARGASTPSLEAEAALLRDAKEAEGAGNFDVALTRLDAHARRFPDGQLADARSRARIRVLCDLGRVAQARGEASLLARRAPHDPLAVQAMQICAAPIQSSSHPEKTPVRP